MAYSFFAYVSRLKLIRRWALMRTTQPENDAEHPGEVEIRLLSADYFGNHIRRVEQRAYFTAQEIGDALEALVYKRLISEGGKAGGEHD